MIRQNIYTFDAPIIIYYINYQCQDNFPDPFYEYTTIYQEQETF